MMVFGVEFLKILLNESNSFYHMISMICILSLLGNNQHVIMPTRVKFDNMVVVHCGVIV